MKFPTRSILTFVAAYIAAELVTATLGYNGIFIGPIILRYVYGEPTTPVTEPNLWEDFRDTVTGNRSTIPSEPIEFTACDGALYGAWWGWVDAIYGPDFAASGMEFDSVKVFGCCDGIGKGAIARCAAVPLKQVGASERDGVVIRWTGGPTCRFGNCATDVIYLNENPRDKKIWRKVDVVLSLRTGRNDPFGFGMTYTNGLRDIVVRGRRTFAWDGDRYRSKTEIANERR